MLATPRAMCGLDRCHLRIRFRAVVTRPVPGRPSLITCRVPERAGRTGTVRAMHLVGPDGYTAEPARTTNWTREADVRWSDLEDWQPRLAEVGRRKLLDPGVVLVATIRRDGAPRVSAVEPFVAGGELWLSMMLGSTKAKDLTRDPQVLVHSVITSRDGGEGEFKVRGTARAETGRQMQHRYAAAVADSLGWRPIPGEFHLLPSTSRTSRSCATRMRRVTSS
jgi:Pyridoxamine 5'-phosphate oxidase